MSGIHDAILEHVRDKLILELITNIDPGDPALAGLVQIGPIQDDPSPDDARISVTVHENDPDRLLTGTVTGMKDDWSDDVQSIEIGGTLTYYRRFTVKARCLLVDTAEDLDNARSIASTVRERIETAILGLSFTGIVSGNEYISRGILSDEFTGEMLQAGGPEAYDYHIKIRFSVLSTRTGVVA